MIPLQKPAPNSSLHLQEIPDSPSAAFLTNSSLSQHPFQKTAGRGLADTQQCIDLFPCDLLVRFQVFDYFLLLPIGGDIRFSSSVAVRQRDLKRIAGDLNLWLSLKVLIGPHNLGYSGSVCLDQLQAVKYRCQFRISANRESYHDIVCSNSVRQAADGDKFSTVVIDADQCTGPAGVVPMDRQFISASRRATSG